MLLTLWGIVVIKIKEAMNNCLFTSFDRLQHSGIYVGHYSITQSYRLVDRYLQFYWKHFWGPNLKTISFYYSK